jgi:hypothetical protein
MVEKLVSWYRSILQGYTNPIAELVSLNEQSFQKVAGIEIKPSAFVPEFELFEIETNSKNWRL